MKEKIIKGPSDRPRPEEKPEHSETIIDVARDGTATQRTEPGQTGAAVADEDPDDSLMDNSPARNKDRWRDPHYDEPGPDDDTYD
ncbi:hypothetical protein [Pelagibacterium mangrovi]|uniref:hypothetical protein n=1 Tax=Pelagibacterium mangrovi TaxID=3119828 RepID=UPI002FC876BC